jgi:metal-responsive CopG/Arc/MetJ family transcriptional regulator
VPLHSLRLPDHLARELDELAATRRTTRSEVIREAIEEYCAAQRDRGAADRTALLRRLVTYRGSGRGDLAERSEHYLRELFRARRRHRSR